MPIRIILSYITGYIRVVVSGYYIERFINMCTNNKIAIWNLKRDKDVTLYLNTTIKDFKELVKIAKKVKCKVEIKKKKGVPFLLNKYKKRKLFLFCLIIVIVLSLISSNFIWNIDIREENGKEIENIAKDLEEVGLKIGEFKNTVDTKEIINKIRLKRSDIAWMGIELKGTNAIVKLVKAEEKPKIIDENEYCSIISNKVGVITKINSQNGTIAVKVGDTVNIGTILIQGWMEGKYTGIRYVHAKGDIEAKVWHTKHEKIYLNVTEEEETGNLENKYSIKINNFQINLYKRVSKFEFYDTIASIKKFKVFSDFYLPIQVVKTTNKELKKVEKTYDIEQAKSLGIQKLEQELDEEIENQENIVNKIVNTYENQDSVDIYVTYEVLENIGTNEKIIF